MGPFTTPLCAGMGYALYWMAGQMREVRVENKALLMQRAADGTQAALDYAEFGETMRNVLRDNAEAVRTFNASAAAVLARAGGG
jgi:hypothetical protein